MLSGPRYLDPGRAADVSERTLKGYRRVVGEFVTYLTEQGFDPSTGEEIDDLLVEWSVDVATSPSRLRTLIAAIEFVIPRSRGCLIWAKQRLDTICRITPPKHTQPAGQEVCLLIGAHLASRGHARMGLGMLLQGAVGLRPGEMLQLCPDDLVVSPEADKKHLVVIRLGHRHGGTKSGREQCVLLDTRRHPDLWHCLCIAIGITEHSQRLFPFAMSSYYAWLKRAQSELNLELDITPHSPRSGFASDCIAAGWPPAQIKEAGRWISESSFRIYIDVVGALRVAQHMRLQGYGEAIEFVRRNLNLYFHQTSLDTYGTKR